MRSLCALKYKAKRLYSVSRVFYGLGCLLLGIIDSFGWSLVAFAAGLIVSAIFESKADDAVDAIEV